jgi:hypothetical protein
MGLANTKAIHCLPLNLANFIAPRIKPGRILMKSGHSGIELAVTKGSLR